MAIILGAEAGADPADQTIPHGPTIAAIAEIASVHMLGTHLKIRFPGVRKVITFSAEPIVRGGKLMHIELGRIKYTPEGAPERLRGEGIFDISQVKCAVCEPNVDISVLKTSRAGAVTRGDIGLVQASDQQLQLVIL